MKTPHDHSALSTFALVQDLDDATLRSTHALLDAGRAQGFNRWLDSQLNELEAKFRAYATPRSVRRSLER